MKKFWKVMSYLLVALAASGVTLAFCLGQPREESKLTKLENLIRERYIGIEDVDMAKVEDAAANAMVEALGDRWSYYLDEESYQANLRANQNAYVGIGITVSRELEETGISVLKVEESGPAKEAGLQAGDIITAVEGQDALELGVDGASELIMGEENTWVEISLLRGGEERTVSVQRRRIETAIATGQMLDGNVGLVRIDNFRSRCAQETIAQIEALLEQGAEALILDVRFNPGGYVTEVVEVLDYLLPEGAVFRSRDYLGKEDVDYSDERCLDIPMAVLVNGSSYSAAEHFAATLSEYGAAVTVGEPTVGKGRYQMVYELGDGSGVGLSVGEYFTPNGVNMSDAGGLTPDVVVTVDEQTAMEIYNGLLEAEDDPQIQAALERLK